MSDPLAGLPPRFLRTPEAARFLGLSGRTLEKHRTYGTGPKYRKIGGRVIYAIEDLKAWADLGAKQSTSDPGKGTVLPAKRVIAVSPILRAVAPGERYITMPHVRPGGESLLRILSMRHQSAASSRCAGSAAPTIPVQPSFSPTDPTSTLPGR